MSILKLYSNQIIDFLQKVRAILKRCWTSKSVDFINIINILFNYLIIIIFNFKGKSLKLTKMVNNEKIKNEMKKL
jgi:hypothetical protein